MRLPYTPVEFTKSGDPADRSQFDTAIKMIGTGTDVLMISHGWNNDIAAAERVFTALTDTIDNLMSSRAPTGRTLTVVGLEWPSKQWAADGGGTGGAGLDDDLTDLIGRITLAVDDPVTRAALQDLAPKLADDGDAQQRFLGILRGLLPPPDAVADDDALPGGLLSGSVPEVLDAVGEARLAAGSTIGTGVVPGPAGGAAAAGLGFHLPKLNPLRALTDVLNTTTFYTMKERAGNVGSRGVAALLEAVAAAQPSVRVHLAGHSFGARVVSAAAATTDTSIGSISLLQGAYSHRGLAAHDDAMPDGAFRRALTGGHLHGPVIVTHTRNDKAVGLAYAVASRLAKQVAADIGGPSDPYGGMGANGAVATAEAVEGRLGDSTTTYAFEPGLVHNLRADEFVGGHSDVTNAAVANAVLAAMLAGSR